MPQLTIELDHEESERLHALAKRKRRSDAQQAARLVVRALDRLERPPAPPPQEADTPYERAAAQYARAERPVEALERALAASSASAEAKRAAAAGLPPE